MIAESGPLGFGPAQFGNQLESDRPDFTDSASTITPGHLQFEGGYTYTTDKSDTHTLPELLTRFGIADSLEGRISWEGWSWTRSGDDNDSSTSNLNLGGKVRILTDTEVLVSAIFDMDLPTGSKENNHRGVEPNAKLLFTYDISDTLELSSNFNFSAPHDEDHDRIFEYSHSASVAKSLCEDIGLFIEYYGFMPQDSDPAGPTHYADGGVTYLLTPDFQLDIRVGFGINGRADDLFSGLGLVYRI